MDDDARILREFQRLSVGAFDDSFKDSLHQEYQSQPKNTFNSLQVYGVNNSHLSEKSKEKYSNYIYNNTKHTINTHKHNDENSDEVSVDDIINDLKRRKEHRLRNKYKNGSYANISSHQNQSRFMLAANKRKHRNSNKIHRQSKNDIERYKDIINNNSNEIKSLQIQLQEKEELIKSLQYKLQHEDEPQPFDGHSRQKSVTQTQTEQSTIENVRWGLRSEITSMTAAENDVNRLLQSVGDTSMIHGRLKKIHRTISVHKRKVSALEQSLHVDSFQISGSYDQFLDTKNSVDFDDVQDFERLSKEYSKLKIEIAELKQEQEEWNNTKHELETVNKRCNNLMSMLDKLSDEKSQLTLQIEDLNAFLNKNNLIYNQ